MIDKNQGRDYPVELLFQWKGDHEAWVAKNLNKSAPEPTETSTTINVTSYNQRGGITAGVLNLGAPSRRLNDKLKVRLLEVLRDKKKEVSITSALGDGEALIFATEIMEFLSGQDFQVRGVNRAVWSKPLRGQTIDPDTYEIRIGTQE